jgi:hypothetical protein
LCDRQRPVRVFLSGVVSETHLVHVSAWLRVLLEATSARVTIVDLGAGTFLGAPRLTTAQIAGGLPTSDRVYLVDKARPGALPAAPAEDVVYLAVGAPGIKPYLRLITAHGRRVRCVVVDEGLGSYAGVRGRWAAIRRERGGTVWPLARAAGVGAARAVLTDCRQALYERRRGRWHVDPGIAAEFALRRGRVTPRRAVVLVSQPWVELGVLDRDRYEQVLQGVRAAAQAAGLDFVLRPHPAEHSARYSGFPVMAPRGPAEQDPDVLGAPAVVGFSSTALINLTAIHGVRTARVSVPELSALDRHLSRAQASLLRTFVAGPLDMTSLQTWLSEQG